VRTKLDGYFLIQNVLKELNIQLIGKYIVATGLTKKYIYMKHW